MLYFFYIIPNIGDTFYSKMLKYKIQYKYIIYIYKYDYINKYITKYEHKLNTRAVAQIKI